VIPCALPNEFAKALESLSTEIHEQVMNYRPSNKPTDRAAHPAQPLRPEAWEDDLSSNALDDRPFDNFPPIGKRLKELTFSPELHAPPEILNRFGQKDFDAFVQNDPWPIPTGEDREGYWPNYDGQYWVLGLVDHLKVMQVAERHEVDIRRYFDFGCASGRVLRHFCAHTTIPELWGSDINQRHIRWLYEHLPARVKPIFNHCIPTLPIEDNYFDLISAFSVFTHLDTYETAWLAELRRILRPGGLAYLTVHNDHTWIALRENLEHRLLKGMRLVSNTVVDDLKRDIPEGRTVYRYKEQGPYRAQVLHSNRYLHNVWGRYLDIVEILPGHHGLQSVVVLRKPSR
jgi:SAM-dependent methyltransferase